MFRRLSLVVLLALLMSLVLVACGGAASNGSMNNAADGATDTGQGEMDHGDTDHAEERVPNNGAVIRIVSPADGAVFKTTDEVLVQVEIENFDLGADGNHWHVVLDDNSEIMVMGGNTDQALRNLAPGQHTIEAILSTGDHGDLEDTSKVTITVEE